MPHLTHSYGRTPWHRPLRRKLVHSQPAKASESKSGPCLAHLPPRAAPAAALVTDAAAPKQSIPAPQKAAMLEGAA